MTTASNAIKACIEDNWNAGSGGTEPTVYTGAEEGMYPSTAEWVFLKTWEYAKRRKRRNDSFVKEDDYVGLRVYTRNHANKEERLDEMVNEIYRIVTPTNVTGYHKVDIIDQHRRATDKRQEMYVADLTVELKILSTASSAVPGSTESGNDWSMDSLIFTDGGSKVDIIRDEDDMVTDDADALATQQSIKAYVDASGGYTDAQAIAAVVAENPLTLTNDLTITGKDIVQAAELNFKVSGDNDDYLSFSTVSNIPKITTIGSTGPYFKSDNATWSQVVIDDDGANFSILGFHKTSHYTRLYSTGSIILMPNADADDYLQINTLANVPTITSGGGSDLDLVTTTNTIGVDEIAALLMWGSGNAAWVPCMYQMHSYTGGFVSDGSAIKGVGTNNSSMLWSLPLPTVKGSLKLYITGLQVGLQDADATDYIDRAIIYGADFDTATEILNDATDYTAPAEIEYALADTDCSSYKVIQIVIATVKATTGDIDIRNVALSCFYAT